MWKSTCASPAKAPRAGRCKGPDRFRLQLRFAWPPRSIGRAFARTRKPFILCGRFAAGAHRQYIPAAYDASAYRRYMLPVRRTPGFGCPKAISCQVCMDGTYRCATRGTSEGRAARNGLSCGPPTRGFSVGPVLASAQSADRSAIGRFDPYKTDAKWQNRGLFGLLNVPAIQNRHGMARRVELGRPHVSRDPRTAGFAREIRGPARCGSSL